MKKLSFAALSLTLVLSASFRPAWAADAQASSAVVAKVGTTTFTEDQMQKELGNSLYQAENNLYQLKKNWIDQQAKTVLFNEAAKQAGLSRQAWEAREITAYAPAPTQQETDQIIQRMVPQGQVPTDPVKLADMKQQATQYLMSQKKTTRENQVYQQLLEKSPLQVMLTKPVAPHIEIGYNDKVNPVKGPKDAPITIVEFTDFQCPWCKRSQDSVKAVEQTYGDKVKVVARQFPLQMHPRAFPAAEASMCAKEQGKYWEYRDKLFEKQELSDDDFKRYAKELGLKQKKFDDCVSSHKYRDQVQADMAEGSRYGVQGTPTFFVNGIQTGFPQLSDTVKDELAKKKS